MHRRLRLDVREGHHLRVLGQALRGDLALRDLAEDAVIHGGPLYELAAVEQQRDGALVDDAYLHGRAEDALRDPDAPLAAQVAELPVERLRLARRRRPREGRPAALLR